MKQKYYLSNKDMLHCTLQKWLFKWRMIMSKNKSTGAGAVMTQRPLGKRIMDNWQLYAMLAVPIVLTIVYKYIPMYGIQIALGITRPAGVLQEVNGLDSSGSCDSSARRPSGV